MGVSLDTRKAHWHGYSGDIALILTWMNDERCLILLPHRRPGAPWFVIKESAAYEWDDSTRDGAAEVIRRSIKACEVLGMEPTRQNINRISSLVINRLPELIRMPSAPPVEFHRQSFGEIKLLADGQLVASEDIRVEKEGVRYG